MSEPDFELLDDFVFEPTPWDLAFSIGIGVDPETDRAALDELADAMLMWAPEPTLERLTGPALEALWDDDLPRWIREGLVRLSGDEPEPDHDEVVVEAVGNPYSCALHDREAGGVHSRQLVQVRASEIFP